MALGMLKNHNDLWSSLDDAEYELLLDEADVATAESVLLEAREMLHRLEIKSHRRDKPERSLRRTEAWT